MGKLKGLDIRMNKVKKDLVKVSAPVLLKRGMRSRICNGVGEKVGLTGQGVLNYIRGGGSNGYMYESIIEEFKKISTVS